MSASAPPTGRNTPPAKKTIPPETEDRIAALPGEEVGDQRRGGDDDPGDAEQRAAHEDRCERIEDVPGAAGRGSGPRASRAAVFACRTGRRRSPRAGFPVRYTVP